MSAEEITFLANVISVAHADGKLSGTEQDLIESIRKELGIKKGDMSAAMKQVESGSNTMKPVGSFSMQVRNMECALRVGYCDGDLDPMENDMIIAFSSAIGLNQEQLELIRADAIAQVKAINPRCASCGAENVPDSKFCSKCGNNLGVAETNEVQIKYDIPKSGVVIEFAESTGASFPKALELAKATPGFQQCIKNKKTWYMAHFNSGKISDAAQLAEALSSLRNRLLYVDGEEQQWDEVFAFIWCASQRNLAYRPVEYCFGKDENRINPWGCRQARMEWSDWASWFCYGQWEKSGLLSKKVQWKLDKSRIKHELSTNVYRFRYCPHLNAELFESVLKHLPDIVVLGADTDWDYHQNYTEVPGSIRIVQQERSSGVTFSSEFWADGIRPKGLKALYEILIRAFAEIKADPSPVKALMK